MTPKEFEEKTRYKPENDDLERVNCRNVGQSTHICCGWCEFHDGPQFACGCNVRRLFPVLEPRNNYA